VTSDETNSSGAVAARVELTLYSRAGCHLCEDMAALLDEFSEEYPYCVKVIDIDADPALRAKYQVLVPVLCLGDKQICHHFLDMTSLRAALRDIAC